MIKSKNPGIVTAIEEVRIMNLSRWLRMRHEMRLKAWRDQKAYEDTAKRIGWETGLAEGKAAGLAEGKAEGLAEGDLNRRRRDILDLLEDLGKIPEDICDRINTEESTDILCQWHKAAARTQSIDEFRMSMK